MKILQVGKYSADSVGGIESMVFELSEYLSSYADIEVVVTETCKKEYEVRYGTVKVKVLPMVANFFSAPIYPALIGYLKSAGDFDIIQISLPNPMAVIAYLLARPKGKLIVWYHSDIIGRFFSNILLYPFLSIFLKKASFIVTTSDNYIATSSLLSKFIKNVIAIPYGIEISSFDNEVERKETQVIKERISFPFILFIGRFAYYKGLPYLMTAMKDIATHLVIIGKGPLEYRLKRLVKKLKIEERVIFLNNIPRKVFGRYILASELLVLPSICRSEAFGVVLIEAMACAKPTVTTDLGTGTSFVCQNGVTGFVVPLRDPNALKDAINKILEDPELAKKMGEAGRKRAEEYFTLKKMGDAFLRVYEEVIDRKNI